jgi:hypothetical protein
MGGGLCHPDAIPFSCAEDRHHGRGAPQAAHPPQEASGTGRQSCGCRIALYGSTDDVFMAFGNTWIDAPADRRDPFSCVCIRVNGFVHRIVSECNRGKTTHSSG